MEVKSGRIDVTEGFSENVGEGSKQHNDVIKDNIIDLITKINALESVVGSIKEDIDNNIKPDIKNTKERVSMLINYHP